MGFFYQWNGDPAFLEPYDALAQYSAAWLAAGEPSSGPTPPPGNEAVWSGGMLKGSAVGAITNVRLTTGVTVSALKKQSLNREAL